MISLDVSGWLVAEVAVGVVPVEVGEVAHLVEDRLGLSVHGTLAQAAQVQGQAVLRSSTLWAFVLRYSEYLLM